MLASLGVWVNVVALLALETNSNRDVTLAAIDIVICVLALGIEIVEIETGVALLALQNVSTDIMGLAIVDKRRAVLAVVVEKMLFWTFDALVLLSIVLLARVEEVNPRPALVGHAIQVEVVIAVDTGLFEELMVNLAICHKNRIFPATSIIVN